MYTYVQVGRTVVGAFDSKLALTRCINMLSPGCKPVLKKGYATGGRQRTPKHRSNEAQRIRYLKPGEFKL